MPVSHSFTPLHSPKAGQAGLRRFSGDFRRRRSDCLPLLHLNGSARAPRLAGGRDRRLSCADLFPAELGDRLLAGGLPRAGGALTLAAPRPIIALPGPTIPLGEGVRSSNPTEVTKVPSESPRLFKLSSRSGHTHRS
jgi:hypothetical protein